MHLINSDNTCALELKIVGYQFPHITDEYYDSNWLMIEVNATHPKGTWSVIDPCLLTFEVEGLANWLEEVQVDLNKRPSYSFTEPCLEFQLHVDAGNRRSLRVYFETSIRPKWAYARSAGQEDLWVDFSLPEIDLSMAAGELRQQLARYPQRVFR